MMSQTLTEKLRALLQECDGVDSAVRIVEALNHFVREGGSVKRTESAVQQLFVLLRLGFLCESAYVRAATCRALRYLLNNREAVDLVLNRNLEWWLQRSLSLHMHSSGNREAAVNRGVLSKEKETQLERTETVRLVRSIALLSPTRFVSGSIFAFLADYVNDYPQLGLGPPPNANQNANMNINVPTAHVGTNMSEQIEFLRSSCALFCELAVLKPTAFTQRGGFSLLTRSLIHATMNGDHKMVEALVLSCTHLLNDKASRSAIRKGIEVEQLIGPLTDEGYLRSVIMMEGTPGNLEVRGQSAASELSTHALLLVFRSWPGLFYSVAHRETMIQPLVNVLFMQDCDRLRVRLLHFLYALFYVRRPAKRYFDEFLSGTHAQSSLLTGANNALKRFSRSRRFDGASRFAVGDGFVVEEASHCLHFRSNSRVNLLDSVLSVQLAVFVECGLLGAIACCALADDAYVAYLAAVLGSDVLRLATRLVPHAVLKRHYSNGTLVRAALRQHESSSQAASCARAQDAEDLDPFSLETLLIESSTESRAARIRHVRAREVIAYLRSRDHGRFPPLKARCVDCAHSLFFDNLLAQAQLDAAAVSAPLGLAGDEYERPVGAADRSGFFEEFMRLAMPTSNFADWNWRALLTLMQHLESAGNELAAKAMAKVDKTSASGAAQKAAGQKSGNAGSKWSEPANVAGRSSEYCLQKCVTTGQYALLVRLFRQLAAFYKPSACQFSKLEDYSMASGAKGLSDEELARESLSRLMAACACSFMELVAAHSGSDSELQAMFDDLIRDIHMALQRIVDPNWQPVRAVDSEIAGKDEAVLSVTSVQRTMSKYYFLMLGRLFRTSRGSAALLHRGIVDSLLELVGPQAHPVLVKLVVSSLDYSNENQTRLVLSKALSSAQPEARLYATRLMRVLLRVNVPFFAHWGVALLCKQVYDASAAVRAEALSIIDEACETPIAVRTVLDSSHLQVHDRGFYASLVFNHLLAHPEGFQLLRRTHLALTSDTPIDAAQTATQSVFADTGNYVDCELQRWNSYAAVRYAKLVEERLYEALTSYEHVEDGDCAHASANRRPPLRDVFVPPHLFGQLCKHLDGLRYLKEHRSSLDQSCKRLRDFALSRFCNNSATCRSNKQQEADDDTVDLVLRHSSSDLMHSSEFNSQSADSVSPTECDLLKANLWNLAHLGSTKLGLQFLIELDVLPTVVRICERCEILSLKGVAYWSLCIVASTSEGADYLARFGWYSVTTGRLSRYSNIVDEQSTDLSVPASPGNESSRADASELATVRTSKDTLRANALSTGSNSQRRRSEQDALGARKVDLAALQKHTSPSPKKRASDFSINSPFRVQTAAQPPLIVQSQAQVDAPLNSRNSQFDVGFIPEADENENESETSTRNGDSARLSHNDIIAVSELQTDKKKTSTAQHRKCYSTDYRQLQMPAQERRTERADSSTADLSDRQSNGQSSSSNRRVGVGVGVDTGFSKSASDLHQSNDSLPHDSQLLSDSDAQSSSTASPVDESAANDETRQPVRPDFTRPFSLLTKNDERYSAAKPRSVLPKESFSRERRSVAMMMHYHRSVSTEMNSLGALAAANKSKQVPRSRSTPTQQQQVPMVRLYQNDDSTYRGICLPVSLRDWLEEQQAGASASGPMQTQLDESGKSSRSATASSGTSSCASGNDRVRLAFVQFGVQLDFSAQEHAERCIVCMTKRLGVCKRSDSSETALAMANAVRLIVALCNSITFKSSLGELRSVRERSPELFTSACFFSEVCCLLASLRNVRIIVRRVVNELFARLDRTSLLAVANDLFVESETTKRDELRYNDTTMTSRDDDSSARRMSIMTDPQAANIVI